ncbi:MAG: hypothetical protein RBG13Loki_0615 [Promethearchaeota archaeon CR_4]|nr:MAG: hypothetical protein RBG13Loki_0615 [Candidatus Lokiarchaeota archaeon CR_4]
MILRVILLKLEPDQVLGYAPAVGALVRPADQVGLGNELGFRQLGTGLHFRLHLHSREALMSYPMILFLHLWLKSVCLPSPFHHWDWIWWQC